MDTYSKPIAERFDWLFNLTRWHSAEYSSPEVFLSRQCHLALHPTDIIAFKCMDGRNNIPVATHTPAAIVHTYAIKKQVEHVFGKGHGSVYPVVCGF